MRKARLLYRRAAVKGLCMATATMAYGERRFGAAYVAPIFVTLVVLFFIAGLWTSQGGPNISSHSMLMWVSLGLVAAVVAMWIALGKFTLIVSDAGVRRESPFGQQEMGWSQITETRYRVIPINLHLHFGLIGALVAMSSKSKGTQLTLELISSDGKKLKVTSMFRDVREAIGMILGRILPPMVQSVKARLQRGETVMFGPVGLSATTVIWKSNAIPVSQITQAEIVGSNLRVKRQGKWLAAFSVRSDKVPNVLVFLEALESLAPQIKATGIDPLARVRM